MGDEEPRDPLEERLRAVQYEAWLSNAPCLYDRLFNHELIWPSLTVQWLPGKRQEAGYITQQLLLGTHTGGTGQNSLFIQDVAIRDSELQDSGDVGSASPSHDHPSDEDDPETFLLRLVLPHDGEVNKARHMPQRVQPDSWVIATKTASGDVFVFDTSKQREAQRSASKRQQLLQGEEEVECTPDLKCTGHTREGYGLAWSPLRRGLLLSGSDDGLVITWDIEGGPLDGRELQPLCKYTQHTNVVEDVDCHQFNPHVFCSVGDDGQLIIWDTRKPPAEGALQVLKAHSLEVNGVAFSPHNPHLLATSSADTTVALWDWRHLSAQEPLHVLEGHTDQVFQVCWCPQSPSILASAGQDQRLLLWDISSIGQQQSPEDAVDGPPELLFVHMGHAGKLNDLSWSPDEDWLVAGVWEDNLLQVWQVTESIRAGAGCCDSEGEGMQ